MRSITAGGSTLYLTADYEDRTVRFDFNTGPGQGSVYATETYNALGARFARRDGFGHSHGYAYDGVSPGDPLLYDSYGGMIYTPGVAQTSGGVGGANLYTNVDALGSVHDTQTNGNATQDALRTDAFGGTVARQGSDTLNLGFAASSSYQTDSDTGLMLLGNRYYDLSTGRFLSPDKAKAGDNWYAYCGNNPLTQTDPTGLSSTDPDITVDGIDLGNDDVAQRIGSFINTSNRDHETDSEIGAYWAVNNVNLKGFTPKQEQMIMDDLEMVEFSPRGAELLGDSKFLYKTLNIVEDRNAYGDTYWKRQDDAVHFDPDISYQIDTDAGRADEPAFILLGHEIGHDVMPDLEDPNGPTDTPLRGPETIYQTHFRDNISINEDPIRAYYGLPARTTEMGYPYGSSWYRP